MTFATRSVENDKAIAEKAKKLYFGSTKIAKAYLGPTKVYDSKISRTVFAQYNGGINFYYADNLNTFRVASNKPTNYAGASIIYDGTKFVTVAQSSASSSKCSSYYSVDGTSWTEGGSFSLKNNRGTLLYTNGKYVHADYNYNNTYAYSTDGITWSTSYQLPDTVIAGVAGNGLLVFKATYGLEIFVSTDGINWTTKELPASSTEISYINGKFMFTGVKDFIWYVYITEDFNTYTQYSLPSNFSYTNGKIIYNKGCYLIQVYQSNLYNTYVRTTDFINYTTHTCQLSQPGDSSTVLFTAANKFAVEAYGYIDTSEDGISWNENLVLSTGLYKICTAE